MDLCSAAVDFITKICNFVSEYFVIHPVVLFTMSIFEPPTIPNWSFLLFFFNKRFIIIIIINEMTYHTK